MERDEIDQVVCKIMHNDGPDRHVDGHDIITDFICSLIDGEDREWVTNYKERVKLRAQSLKNDRDTMSKLLKNFKL